MIANKTASRTKWALDQANSKIGFSVANLLISHVKGEFKTFDSCISTAGNNFSTVQINFWIDTASITTNHVKRDRHLKSSDFFNVKNYRYIQFTSCVIGIADTNGEHELCGELTMLGITREIKLQVHFGGMLNDHLGNIRVAFTVTGTINRSEWGFEWNVTNETGSLVIGDEVTIQCDVELTNKSQKELRMQQEYSDNYSLTV